MEASHGSMCDRDLDVTSEGSRQGTGGSWGPADWAETPLKQAADRRQTTFSNTHEGNRQVSEPIPRKRAGQF
jgi:hypothetical protein